MVSTNSVPPTDRECAVDGLRSETPYRVDVVVGYYLVCPFWKFYIQIKEDKQSFESPLKHVYCVETKTTRYTI